jgi:small subunit ribosomal protein S20
MANSPSAKKSARQIARRTAVNKSRRSQMKTFVRSVEEALAAKNVAVAKDAFITAQSSLTRAAQKGIIHANSASRKISRLAARLKAISA